MQNLEERFEEKLRSRKTIYLVVSGTNWKDTETGKFLKLLRLNWEKPKQNRKGFWHDTPYYTWKENYKKLLKSRIEEIENFKKEQNKNFRLDLMYEEEFRKFRGY